MAQPSPAEAYGGMEDLDVSMADIESRLSELLPRLFPAEQQSDQGLAGEVPGGPVPLADARLKAVKTQLSRFPGQEVPEEEMI